MAASAKTAAPRPEKAAAPAVQRPHWLRRYRFLLGIYGVALVFGIREYLVTHGRERFGWLSPEGRELTEILAEVNPGYPEEEFLLGMQSLADGRADEFQQRMDRALSAGMKHDEMMLRMNAQYLLDTSSDVQAINHALNQWRLNHPYSREPVTLQLAQGPRSEAESALIVQALAQVPWIADSQLVRLDDRGTEVWQVKLLVRRNRTIDIRQAWDAVSVRFSG